MKGNGIVTNEDLHKHTSNNEEVYFQKVNTELLRRIKEKKEREKSRKERARREEDKAADEAA